ncbi:uncharacterized protein LOC101855976 [Aplysia californica]|uniref:Uncharacterized protein LOC101855976 n=1 Tax=Aplysia californica TaxID=6500 RepID=A0ABM0K4A6_APLCA|nr:uncharacterized protein LOC101855976 [Aplysia californica]
MARTRCAGSMTPARYCGFVMVACSFVVHMFTVGTMFSLGVLYVSWLQDFGQSKGLTSWVVSIGVAFLFGIGPLPSALVGRFGNRIVQVIGSFMVCGGFALSYFVTSVPQLIFTVGVVGGIGLGFNYLPAVTMIAEYFNKRRAVAYGIATAGVGIGSFLQAPLINWLEDRYSWRGAMLILSAIHLHLNIPALLMKPRANFGRYDLDVEQEAEKDGEGDELEDTSVLVDGVKRHHGQGGFPEKDAASVTERLDNGEPPSGTSLSPSPSHLSPDHDPSGQSPDHQTTTPQRPVNKFLDVDRLSSGRTGMGGSYQHLHARSPSDVNPRQFSSVSELRLSTPGGLGSNPAGQGSDSGSRKSSFRNIDMLMCGSLYSLRMADEKLGSKNSLHYNTLASKTVPEEGDVDSLKETPVVRTTPRGNAVVRGLHYLIDHFSLLKDKIFFSLALSNIFTNLSFLMPILYMVDRAVEAGIDKSSAAILVSINGIGNLLGRFLFGLLGDLPCVDSVVLYVLTLTVCGAGTCMSPVCGGSLVLHGVYSAFFGIFMGGYVSLAPVVTVELMGVARVGQAYGILLFFMGVSGALGPPLAGWVYEWTGGFTAAFILHGAWIILSAAVLLPAVVSRHCRKRR